MAYLELRVHFLEELSPHRIFSSIYTAPDLPQALAQPGLVVWHSRGTTMTLILSTLHGVGLRAR